MLGLTTDSVDWILSLLLLMQLGWILHLDTINTRLNRRLHSALMLLRLDSVERNELEDDDDFDYLFDHPSFRDGRTQSGS